MTEQPAAEQPTEQPAPATTEQQDTAEQPAKPAPMPREFQHTTKAKFTARQREEKALAFRLAGLSYEQVAAQGIGYSSRAAAYKAVQRAINRIPAENAKELRQLELDRLDTAQASIWKHVRTGDLWAIDRLLAIMAQRAKYLGLYEKPADDNTVEVKNALIGFLAGATSAADTIVAAGMPADPTGAE